MFAKKLGIYLKDCRDKLGQGNSDAAGRGALYLAQGKNSFCGHKRFLSGACHRSESFFVKAAERTVYREIKVYSYLPYTEVVK